MKVLPIAPLEENNEDNLKQHVGIQTPRTNSSGWT